MLILNKQAYGGYYHLLTYWHPSMWRAGRNCQGHAGMQVGFPVSSTLRRDFLFAFYCFSVTTNSKDGVVNVNRQRGT